VAGALIDAKTRRAVEMIVSRGGSKYRVPVDRLVSGGESALVLYVSDAGIEEEIREAISKRRVVPTDDMSALGIAVENGTVRVRGNTRTPQALVAVYEIAAGVRGVRGVSEEAVDDGKLEFDIAAALHRSGVLRGAEVYPRSRLGEITLFGFAVSAEAASEVVLVTSRVPGVQAVQDRIEVRAPAVVTA
jgi:osmotically-inducible protein OsmY